MWFGTGQLLRCGSTPAVTGDGTSREQSSICGLALGTCSGLAVSLLLQEMALAENKAAYAREALERRRLHNVVQELRGNIRYSNTSRSFCLVWFD